MSSMLMMNPLKTERMMWESMVKGQDPRAAMRESMDPAKNLSEDGKFWSTLGSAFIQPYQKAMDEGKPMEAVGRGAFEVASLLLGGAEAKAGKVASESATVAKTANKVTEVAGVTERAAQVTGKTEAVGNTKLVTQKAGTKKTLPKSNSGKAKSKSSSKKEPISSTGKVKEVENLQSGGLENRGYSPKADERRTTKVEHKTQSSAKRNFPGQQNEMNCASQSCQPIIRASTGHNLSEAEMSYIAKWEANYESKVGTPASQVPNILNSQGVAAKTMSNTPHEIQTALGEGKGVVSNHDTAILWGEDVGGHAVHVTSVVRDKNGRVTHYVINDTGTGEAGKHVPVETYESSLLEGYPATVTEEPLSYGGRTATRARQPSKRASADKNAQSKTTNKATIEASVGTKETPLNTEMSLPVQELYGRQLNGEYNRSAIRRYKKSMQQEGFDSDYPIRVAEVNGRKIIIDGHHRSRAAGAAGIKEVPVIIEKLSPEESFLLEQQAAEAAQGLGLEHRWNNPYAPKP
jgi:ParB-like nuclease domain